MHCRGYTAAGCPKASAWARAGGSAVGHLLDFQLCLRSTFQSSTDTNVKSEKIATVT